MKKRVFSAVIAIVILLSVLPASAAGGSLDNFTVVNEYEEGTFRDVPSGEWYEENVEASYELGLFLGDGQGSFDPLGKINIAQALTVACRIHSVYYGRGLTFPVTNPWYDAYVSYAVENGIIGEGDFTNLNKTATRGQFAYIMANALPNNALPAVNDVEYGDIPDVAGNEYYGEAVYRLYRAGVTIGSDQYGTYMPDMTIDRCAVAAIATRLAKKVLRIETALKPENPVYVGEYFTIEMPRWLTSICVAVPYGNGISFCEKISYDAGYGGFNFAVIAIEKSELDYCYNPLTKVITDDGRELYLVVEEYGTVDIVENNSTALSNYYEIGNNSSEILWSIKPRNCEFESISGGWKNEYKELIQQFRDINGEAYYMGYGRIYHCYAPYDIDKDGIPELIYMYGTADEEEWVLCRYNPTINMIDETVLCPAYAVELCGTNGENAFYAHYLQGYNEEIVKISLINDKMSMSSVYYTTRADSYVELDNISIYDISDNSGLNWNGNAYTNNRQIVEALD